MNSVLGIMGAGKLGTAIAKTAVIGGLEVWMTSRNVGNTRLIAEVMVPGVKVGTLSELVANAEVIVLAVPLHSVRDLPRDAFDGKLLIDATNYWEPVDGTIGRYGVASAETSTLVQAHFTKAQVVKGMNQLGYHDVEDGRRPKDAKDRLGVAVAGDDSEAKHTAMALVDTMGFDPVDAGTLADGARLGPGGPAFGVALTTEDLRRAIGAA